MRHVCLQLLTAYCQARALSNSCSVAANFGHHCIALHCIAPFNSAQDILEVELDKSICENETGTQILYLFSSMIKFLLSTAVDSLCLSYPIFVKLKLQTLPLSK